MGDSYKSCKNCVHYKIAIFGPLNQGHCTRESYKIVYDPEKRVFEKIKLQDGSDDLVHMPGVCQYFKPHIPEDTYQWFLNLFNNRSEAP
ncbi:MAG: hypothetical protein Kow00108_07610 [Calditrichia bacterium]